MRKYTYMTRRTKNPCYSRRLTKRRRKCSHMESKSPYIIHRTPLFWKGWRQDKPGYKEKRRMFVVCGKKCFLNPPYGYPICASKTCKVDKRGVMSAYIRARQYHNNSVTRRAMSRLKKMHVY